MQHFHKTSYNKGKGDDILPVIKKTDEQTALVTAEGEGQLGRLIAGNMGIDRVSASCLDFEDIQIIEQIVYQRLVDLKPLEETTFIKSLF